MKKAKRREIPLTEDEEKRLVFLCGITGMKPGATIRLLINQVAESQGYKADQEYTGIEAPKNAIRLWCRLMPDEWKKAEEDRKRNLFSSMSAYLVSLIRQATTGASFLPAAEIAELQKIQSELNSIGRNVNQIAKRINEEWREGTPEVLREVLRYLKRVEQIGPEIQSKLERAMTRHF